MAGLYLHIPFCKQACTYCDFHFSTSLKKKPELVKALCRELEMRKDELCEPVETIYFGGGTPSLLSGEELARIFNVIFEAYTVTKNPEITLEANPDDLSREKVKQLTDTPVNRLSIGVQSFFEDDLKWMNRSHNAQQALEALHFAKESFDNFTIDLIYGVPGMGDDKWEKNLTQFLALEIPHLSAYALTVEPNTVLGKRIAQGKMTPVDEQLAKTHYDRLIKMMKIAGYVNYEFSNFGKPGYFSRNNTGYWMGKPYLGIGPSAHGFDGEHRSWSTRNNSRYIKAIARNELPLQRETLSVTNRYNEYIMTRLRTMWGISKKEIERQFGAKYSRHFEREAQNLFAKNLLETRRDKIHIPQQKKFLGDGISAELFYVEEED